MARSDSSSLKYSIKQPGRTPPRPSTFHGQTGALTRWHTGIRSSNEVLLGFVIRSRLPNVPISSRLQQVAVRSQMIPWRPSILDTSSVSCSFSVVRPVYTLCFQDFFFANIIPAVSCCYHLLTVVLWWGPCE